MKVAVVGGCASGKSTITEALSRAGCDAYVVGQEHSAIPHLWRRHGPDALVYLEVSLEKVRERRDPYWPEWLYWRQLQRLQNAREAASIVVNTGEMSVEESIKAILQTIAPDRSP